MSENANAEMYFEEVTPSNQVKGFTKSFQKRSKDKKSEDQNVVELLNFVKANKVILGTKVTEKTFKKGQIQKVYVASNSDELTLDKLNHYAKIAKVDVVELELDNSELAQKLGKPFLISTIGVKK